MELWRSFNEVVKVACECDTVFRVEVVYFQVVLILMFFLLFLLFAVIIKYCNEGQGF